MRFILIALLVLLVCLALGYLLFKTRVDGYIKYYNLGKSCFDKKTQKYDEVLDEHVLASEEVSSLNATAYIKCREHARKKFNEAQGRYRDFIQNQ